MVKLIHNRSIVKYFLAALGIAFAIFYAFSLYPVGEFIGKQFLQDAPGGAQAFALVCAAVMAGCVLLLIFHKEYMKEDSQAYSLATGDRSFENSFKYFTWFVLGLELCSVLFRAILLHFNSVSIVFLFLGVLGMAVTYVVGKQLHVQVNRPPSVAAKYMREEAARSVFDDGRKFLGKLNIAQRRRVAGGDPQPIDDLRDEKAREREEEVARIRARNKATEDEQERNHDFYTKMVSPTSPTPLIEQPSGNGKQPNFQ